MLKGWGSFNRIVLMLVRKFEICYILRGGDLSFLPRSKSIFKYISKYELRFEICFMSRVRPSKYILIKKYDINIHKSTHY
jgi:hypothetical protein